MKKKFFVGFILAVMLVMGFALVGTASFAEETDSVSQDTVLTGTVNATTLMVREQPGTTYTILGKLSNGTQVTIVEENDDNWYKIIYNDGYGWVCGDYIRFGNETVNNEDNDSDNTPGKIVTGTVDVASLMFREEPDNDSKIIDRFYKDDKLNVYCKYGDWYRVVSNGKDGWVYADYITGIKSIKTLKNVKDALSYKPSDGKSDPAAAIDPANMTLAEKIAAYGKTQIGKPYMFYGTGPDGYDCSGFTWAIYNEYGVSVPRNSSGYATFGTAIKESEVRLGDIVTFSVNGSSISHVGMCLGDGNFIHSSSSSGVTITDLHSNYWEPKIFGFRRVL